MGRKKIVNNSNTLFDVNVNENENINNSENNDKKELIERIVKNIVSLAVLNKINIGDLEKDSGVSIGYFSRLKKNSAQKIPIEMLIKVSDILNISIDALLKDDIKKQNDREKMLRDFIDRIIKDTEAGSLYWESYKLGTEESTLEEGDQYNDIITAQDLIRVYGCHSQVNMKFVPTSTAYVAELEDVNSYVIILKGGYSKRESYDDPLESLIKPDSYEVYLRKNCETNYICSTYELFGYVRIMIGQLYTMINTKNSKIVLNDFTKDTIEKYLNSRSLSNNKIGKSFEKVFKNNEEDSDKLF